MIKTARIALYFALIFALFLALHLVISDKEEAQPGAAGGAGAGASYGTCRFTLLLPPGEGLMLSFVNLNYALRLYADGALLATVGEVGETEETPGPSLRSTWCRRRWARRGWTS